MEKDFPINDYSLKLEVNNPNELSKTKIFDILRKWCENKLIKNSELCVTLRTTIIQVQTQLARYNIDCDKGLVEAEQGPGYLSLLGILEQLRSSLAQTAEELIAYTMIPQGRIIDHNIYYEARQSSTIDGYLGGYKIPNGSGTKVKVINKIMADILTQNQLSVTDSDTEWISFKPALSINSKFALLDVSYKPFSGAQEYFEKNFLQPDDKIINWYDDPGRSSATRMVSTVSVDLFSKATPPKRLTRGPYVANQANICWEMEEETKQLKATFEKMWPIFEKSELGLAEQALEISERLFQGEKDRLEAEKERLEVARKTPPHLKVADTNAMNCDIRFIQQWLM